MIIKQIYTGCLNEAAYFVEDSGEAVIIDPIRETDEYLSLAKEHQARIKYIFETHFHTDFVSGHLDLSKKTGAPVVFGPNTEARFDFHKAADGEVFKIGKITIEAVHTPGHTLESTSYLLRDEEGRPHCIFTGDTLMIGKIGLPDQSTGQLSREELAVILYHTIQNKILPLPDDVIIYPAHVALSQNKDTKKQSTIGKQKKENPALQSQSIEDFVKAITNEKAEVPPHYPVNARINREGYTPLGDVLKKSLIPLTPDDFNTAIRQNCTVLDSRKVEDFIDGFIPGSISITLDGHFAEWAGRLLPYNQPIFLVTDPRKEEESITRLARVGFENVKGYLEGGYEAWKKSNFRRDLIIDIEPDEFEMDLPFDENILVLDVRHHHEFVEGHVADAANLPLNEMTDVAQFAGIEEDQNLYVYSAEGLRSVTAVSLLKKQGYHNIRNIRGGFNSIKLQTKIPTEKSGEVLN